MQDNQVAQPTTDQPVAQPAAPTMPAADVTMTPVPAVDVNTTVTETPAMATEAVVTETPAQVGPAPVDMSDVKVELPEVPAQVTSVATETPVTPTV
jgi:hypothetical protein